MKRLDYYLVIAVCIALGLGLHYIGIEELAYGFFMLVVTFFTKILDLNEDSQEMINKAIQRKEEKEEEELLEEFKKLKH